MKNGRIQAIDLCAGGGGWACAARGLPIDVFLAVDVEHWYLVTYGFNHPGTMCVQADVLAFAFSPLKGKVDLILAGIPCRLVSPARGHHAPREDELAALDALVERLLALPGELGAKWWCYEDVPGILARLPMATPYVRINSGDYSAQRRERVYIGRFPAVRRGRNADMIEKHLRPGPHVVTSRLWKGNARRSATYGEGAFFAWERGMKSATITKNFGGAAHAKVGIREMHPQRKGHTICRCNDRDWRPTGVKREQNDSAYYRCLEFPEAARLQGFPESYVFIGTRGHAQQMVAQAVQVETGRAILRAICREAGLLSKSKETA